MIADDVAGAAGYAEPMRAILLALSILASSTATAHPLRASALVVDVHDDVVAVEMQIPLDELARASTTTTTTTTTTMTMTTQPADTFVTREGARFVEFAKAAFAIDAGDGRAFTLAFSSPRLEQVDAVAHVVVDVTATPPAGASTRRFTLTDTAIVDVIDDHRIYVELRHDFAGGVLGHDDAPRALIGVLDGTRPSVVVDRGDGAWTTGFSAVFLLGTHHIADGTDHLLFLLVLLLPASLVARGGRWREAKPVSSSLRQIVGVVTAFTIGHSITLALASFQLVAPSSQLVETVIALSIAVSAAHAIRPLFAGREAVVAGVFGLVHGLAFATVLGELGVRGTSLAVSLLAFNVGIEVMQLVVILVTMPWLVLLARTPVGAPVRIVVAVFAAIAAIAWAVERVFVVDTPVTVVVEGLADRAPWLLAALAALSLFATWRQRRR